MKKYFLIVWALWCFYTPAFVTGADRYEVSFGTDFPTQVGIKGRVNLNPSFYLTGTGGFAIKPYMDSYEVIFSQLGVADSQWLGVVSAAWANSLVLSGQLGFASSIYEGPYIELGYTVMLWGRGEVKTEQLPWGRGQQGGAAAAAGASPTYQVPSTHHGPTVTAGYRFVLVDKMFMNWHIGMYKPLFSHTGKSNGASLEAAHLKQIHSFLLRSVYLPFVGVWLGLSF